MAKCRAGYLNFLVRGRDEVCGEWSLMALCYNFSRLLPSFEAAAQSDNSCSVSWLNRSYGLHGATRAVGRTAERNPPSPRNAVRRSEPTLCPAQRFLVAFRTAHIPNDQKIFAGRRAPPGE